MCPKIRSSYLLLQSVDPLEFFNFEPEKWFSVPQFLVSKMGKIQSRGIKIGQTMHHQIRAYELYNVVRGQILLKMHAALGDGDLFRFFGFCGPTGTLPQPGWGEKKG